MRRKKKKPWYRPPRTSGNGTAAKQWIYVFWNIPFVWVVKIGIAGNVKDRHRGVDRSSPGWDIPIWFIPIFFAYQLEQAIHRGCSFLQVPFWGSGHTERFFILAAIPAVILSLLFFIAEWVVYAAMALLMIVMFTGENPLKLFIQ